MTSFEDGPAKGQNLMLRRSPFFLRVVQAGGKFDGLDQIADEPADGEKIFAYRVTGHVSQCHIRASGGRGGFWPVATYKLIPDQPPEDVLKDNRLWAEWCEDNRDLYEQWKRANEQ